MNFFARYGEINGIAFNILTVYTLYYGVLTVYSLVLVW